MEGDLSIRLFISCLLVVGNAFFVAAEYSLVSARKSRLESLARRGNRNAKRVIEALDSLSVYVAAIQVGITVFSIGAGALTEPLITGLLENAMGTTVPKQVSLVISLVLVTYVMVVIGELVPKYVTLNRPERMAMFVIAPMRLFALLLKPLVKLIEISGAMMVRPFGIRVDASTSEAIPREELLLLVKAGSSEGMMDKVHADIISRAMQIDRLMARDIMVHRLDIKWIRADLNKEETLKQLAKIAHTRILICREDIDDVAGIVYINDIVKRLGEPKLDLEAVARPAISVPENLTLDKVVTMMREEKSQILLVVDEYGGTSGIITLEDVVEEIFGELEDSLESEREPIEISASGRVSAKADVRYDELLTKLGIEWDDEPNTNTLANVMIEELGRMPKMGDQVMNPLGALRIENMARRRVTRISIQLNQAIATKLKVGSGE
jgi:CBS domain containing-hemolysin-like protein